MNSLDTSTPSKSSIPLADLENKPSSPQLNLENGTNEVINGTESMNISNIPRTDTITSSTDGHPPNHSLNVKFSSDELHQILSSIKKHDMYEDHAFVGEDVTKMSLWQRFGNQLWRGLKIAVFLLTGPIVAVLCWFFAVIADYALMTFNYIWIDTLWYGKYLLLFVVPLGLALNAFLTQKFFNGAQASGIPQTELALRRLRLMEERTVIQENYHSWNLDRLISQDPNRTLLREPHGIPVPRPKTQDEWLDSPQPYTNLLSVRILVGKILMTTWSIFFGMTAGREGPSVQIGASVGLFMSWLGTFPLAETKGAIMAGGGSGISGAFNVPLSGAVFAIEELGHAYTPKIRGLILSTAVLCGLTALAIPGDGYVYFGQVNRSCELSVALFFTLISCGVIAGGLAGILVRLVTLTLGPLNISKRKFWKLMREQPSLRAGLLGFILALFGLIPGSLIYGAGYDEALTIVNITKSSKDPWTEIKNFNLAAMFPLKWIGLYITFVAGLPAGTLAPGISCGFGLGALLSKLFEPWFNPIGSARMALTFAGCISFFAGLTQAPLTSYLIFQEILSLDYSWILPMASCALVSAMVSGWIHPEPIYEALSELAIHAQLSKDDMLHNDGPDKPLDP